MSPPMVSVVMPVHDGERTLRAAVRSVLAQSLRSLELLVVDDASRDGTLALAREAARRDRRVRVLRNPRNLGITGALNRGLAAARGRYIARIDHDDVWTRRDKLARQLAVFARRPATVLVGTGARYLDAHGRVIVRSALPAGDRAIRHVMFFQLPFIHSSVLFRRDLLRRTGPYRADPPYVEDYQLWLEMGKHGELAVLPAPMVDLVKTSGSITGRHRLLQLRGVLRLIWRYRRDYPHPWLAAAKRLLDLLPFRVAGRFKSRWMRAWA